MIKVEAESALASLRRLSEAPAVAVAETHAIGADLMQALNETTPVRTGALLDSEELTEEEDGATVQIGGGTVDYAIYVNARVGFADEAAERVLPDSGRRVAEAVREHVKG